MAEMNLIPLIDIALTLLIIMMVTTAFIKHPGVSLKLPETKTREGAPETNKDLVIYVTSDGAIYLDGLKRMIEAQRSVGAINGEVDYDKIIDTRFLPDDLKKIR